MNTLIYIVLFICVLNIIYGRIKYKEFSNPLVIFNILWMFVLAVIPYSNDFGIFTPSHDALKIILIGIVSINIGMFFARKHTFKFGDKLKYQAIRIYEPRTRLITIIAVISVFVAFSDVVESIQALMNGISLADIRDIYYSNENVGILFYLKQYFFLPMQYVVIVCAILSIIERKKNKILPIFALIIVGFQIITSGGRYIIVNSIFMLIILMSIYDVTGKLKRKTKTLIYTGILLAIIIVIFITNERTSVDTQDLSIGGKVIQTIYSYYAGSVTYLGRVIEKYPQIHMSTYGVNFIAGFIAPVFAALTFLNILPYPKFLQVIGTYACEQMAIGRNVYYNAMPTMFLYFYIDFGYIGVFIESFVLGYVFMRSFIKMNEKRNWASMGSYVLLCLVMLNSSQRYFMYTETFALAFLYLRWVCKSDVYRVRGE